MNKVKISLIEKQFSSLKINYPGLHLSLNGGHPIIRGPLDFHAKYGGEAIRGFFNIEIIFIEDYPNSPPIAKEIGGCIPSDFHKYQNDVLCLSTPAVIKLRFSINPTLVAFVEGLVIPYLYSFRYWDKYGSMPYGEYDHDEGEMQSYKDIFNTSSDSVVRKLLRIDKDNYREHQPCPCDSGKRLRYCHGPILLELGVAPIKTDTVSG